MKRLSTIIIGVLSLFVSSEIRADEFHGLYSGYYVTCERISLDFKSSHKVKATISSADFVGHFFDEMYGKYEKRGDSIFIKWTSVSKDNVNDDYKCVPTGIDTVILTNSPDTIRFISCGEHKLANCSIIKQNQTSGDGFGSLLFILCFRLFEFVFCIIFICFVVRFIYKRLKKENE